MLTLLLNSAFSLFDVLLLFFLRRCCCCCSLCVWAFECAFLLDLASLSTHTLCMCINVNTNILFVVVCLLFCLLVGAHRTFLFMWDGMNYVTLYIINNIVKWFLFISLRPEREQKATTTKKYDVYINIFSYSRVIDSGCDFSCRPMCKQTREKKTRTVCTFVTLLLVFSSGALLHYKNVTRNIFSSMTWIFAWFIMIPNLDSVTHWPRTLVSFFSCFSFGLCV